MEPKLLKSTLRIPYSWAAGKTATRFYKELKEQKKLSGTKCPACLRVLFPPRKICPRCFEETKELVEVQTEGVVESFTVVHDAEPSIQPQKPPIIYALIKLKGADTSFIHIVKASSVKTGLEVKAVFCEKPQGNILDIAYFETVEAPAL